MEKKEYAEFMLKQEQNFLEKFGEPLNKQELLFIARKLFAGQIEQYLRTQLYHLQGKRMLGFIKQAQEDIETALLATNDEMQELLKGLDNEPETKQGSRKRNRRTTGKGPNLALVHTGSDTGGEQTSPPGSEEITF